MRLWLLDEVKEVENDLKALIRVLVERAENEKDYILPGYTHLQVRCLCASVDHPLNSYVYREVNRYDGHIFSFLTPFLYAMTSTAFVNLFREFLSCLSAAAHWPATLSLLTENFLQKNWDSFPLLRIASGELLTATSLQSF